MSAATKKPATTTGKHIDEIPAAAARTRRPSSATTQAKAPAAAPPAPAQAKPSPRTKAPVEKTTTSARSAGSKKPATVTTKTPTAHSRTSPAPAAPDPSVEVAPPALEAVKPISRGPRGPYNIVRVNKKAATFRLPQDVLDLIRVAQEEAASLGRKLTNDDAVAEAVRGHYGRRRRRRA